MKPLVPIVRSFFVPKKSKWPFSSAVLLPTVKCGTALKFLVVVKFPLLSVNVLVMPKRLRTASW